MALSLRLMLGLFRRHAGESAPDNRLITSDGNDFLTADGEYFLVA